MRKRREVKAIDVHFDQVDVVEKVCAVELAGRSRGVEDSKMGCSRADG